MSETTTKYKLGNRFIETYTVSEVDHRRGLFGYWGSVSGCDSTGQPSHIKYGDKEADFFKELKAGDVFKVKAAVTEQFSRYGVNQIILKRPAKPIKLN